MNTSSADRALIEAINRFCDLKEVELRLNNPPNYVTDLLKKIKEERENENKNGIY